jgi:hypothetical protein
MEKRDRLVTANGNRLVETLFEFLHVFIRKTNHTSVFSQTKHFILTSKAISDTEHTSNDSLKSKFVILYSMYSINSLLTSRHGLKNNIE